MTDLTDYLGYDRIFVEKVEEIGMWVKVKGGIEWVKVKVPIRPVVRICPELTSRKSVVHVCANKLETHYNPADHQISYRVGGTELKEIVCWLVPYTHYKQLAELWGYEVMP